MRDIDGETGQMLARLSSLTGQHYWINTEPQTGEYHLYRSWEPLNIPMHQISCEGYDAMHSLVIALHDAVSLAINRKGDRP